MELGAIAGTISSTIFMLSQIPMLLKVIRTRSMNSYSLVNILMATSGNLIHWCYISTLPFGPIWFLHSFNTLTAGFMLIWYLRYEKRSSSNQSILNSALFENGSDIMKKVNKETTDTGSGKEMSDFHIHFRPFVDSIYRGALVMTGNPRNAEKLQVQIYMKAFMLYLQTNPGVNFKEWVLEIVADSFSELRNSKTKVDSNSEVKQEKAMQAITFK